MRLATTAPPRGFDGRPSRQSPGHCCKLKRLDRCQNQKDVIASTRKKRKKKKKKKKKKKTVNIGFSTLKKHKLAPVLPAPRTSMDDDWFSSSGEGEDEVQPSRPGNASNRIHARRSDVGAYLPPQAVAPALAGPGSAGNLPASWLETRRQVRELLGAAPVAAYASDSPPSLQSGRLAASGSPPRRPATASADRPVPAGAVVPVGRVLKEFRKHERQRLPHHSPSSDQWPNSGPSEPWRPVSASSVSPPVYSADQFRAQQQQAFRAGRLASGGGSGGGGDMEADDGGSSDHTRHSHSHHSHHHGQSPPPADVMVPLRRSPESLREGDTNLARLQRFVHHNREYLNASDLALIAAADEALKHKSLRVTARAKVCQRMRLFVVCLFVVFSLGGGGCRVGANTGLAIHLILAHHHHHHHSSSKKKKKLPMPSGDVGAVV